MMFNNIATLIQLQKQFTSLFLSLQMGQDGMTGSLGKQLAWHPVVATKKFDEKGYASSNSKIIKHVLDRILNINTATVATAVSYL